MTPILQLDALAIWKRSARTAGLVLAGLCGAMAHATGPIDTATVEGASVAALREQASGYEHGAGIAKDMTRALALYCEAARLGDADAQFNLGWIYANGRGVPRDDSTASFFFAAAAEQGVEQARRMLDIVGPPGKAIPACMILPEVPPPEPAPAAAPFQIRTSAPKPLVDLVKKMAPAYRIEPQLVLAIIEVESNFDSAALSPKNAKGLMQLIPDTASRFNVKDAYDPKQNIRGGLAYLRWLLAYFEGDLALVAAAYNAGEGTVERYRGVPPYAETRRYVSRILQAAGSSVHPYDAHVVAPSPRLRAIRTAALGN